MHHAPDFFGYWSCCACWYASGLMQWRAINFSWRVSYILDFHSKSMDRVNELLICDMWALLSLFFSVVFSERYP
ncbi:hypothetical protein F4802DRAFT_545863 [Xylaria palmicola]|nr:hypothetical protein F4802DRAFT_545863 [Xylaria palmicola]